MLVLQNAPLPALEMPSLDLRLWDVDNGTSKFDLSLFLVDGEPALRGWLEYSTDLFDRSTAERMVGHFQTLLEGAVREPDCPVSRLPVRPVSRSDDAIIEIKFESRFNGRDESRVNVSTAVFC